MRLSPSLQASADEQRSDQISDRMGELMHKFPFYSATRAQAIAETELSLLDEMQQNDGEW